MWARYTIKLVSTSCLYVAAKFLPIKVWAKDDPEKTKAKATSLFVEKVKKISAPFNVTTDNAARTEPNLFCKRSKLKAQQNTKCSPTQHEKETHFDNSQDLLRL